jgi:hypothetical protein
MKTKEIIARLRVDGDNEAADRMEQLLISLTQTGQHLKNVRQERDAFEVRYVELTYKIQNFLDDISH